MLTPFDWQEGIGNRAAYVEGKIAQGSPVLAVSLNAGILIMTYRRQSQKIFEIYDHIGMAAIGQQSDIEAIRVSAVEFAHREGFSRSEADVTIQRVVNAVSAPIKAAFGDFRSAPLVANSLFVEIAPTPDQDFYYTIEFDGDFHLLRNSVILAGNKVEDLSLHQKIAVDTDPTAAVELLKEHWLAVVSNHGENDVAMDGLNLEAVLLERNSPRENAFISIVGS